MARYDYLGELDRLQGKGEIGHKEYGKVDPIKPSKPSVSTSGGATSSIGGSGGGGGGTVVAPKVPTYKDLSPEMRKIYDSLKAYDPDYQGLQQGQDALNKLYDQQIGEARDWGNLQQGKLDAQQERLARDSKDARLKGLSQFREGRTMIQEQMFDITRANEEALASRGIGDSGQAQLAQVQSQMASGDAVSGLAEQYYQLESELQRNLDDANDQFQTATLELSQTVQQSITQITEGKVRSNQDYTKMIEGIRQSVVESSNNVSMLRNQLIQTQFSNDMTLANFKEQQRQFNASLSAQKSAQAQAQKNADRDFALKKEQMAKQGDSLGSLEALYDIQGMISEGVSKNVVDAFAKEYGISDNPTYKTLYNDAFGLGIPASTDTKKKSGLSGLWDSLTNANSKLNQPYNSSYKGYLQ